VAPRSALRRTRPARFPAAIVVDGDWFYASGIHQAHWALCQVSVDTGAEPPDVRFALLPASDFTIKSTWDIAGMQSSGSDGFTVREVFVPEHRTLAVHKVRDATLQTVEGERDYYTSVATMLAASIAGPVIGMAQGALDNVLEMLPKGKAITGSVYTDAVCSPSIQMSSPQAQPFRR
jgi:alkylation response protein AidB-like acyl-CoA dehydrogenase